VLPPSPSRGMKSSTPRNESGDFILAIVEFLPNDQHRVHYFRKPFQREPDFGVTNGEPGLQ
jgi:hypothetical protein